MKRKNIVIIATLDTKGEEAEFLKKLIESKGHNVIVVDAGILGKPKFKGDIPREKIAELGGRSLDDLVKDAKLGVEKMKILQVIIKGVKKAVLNLYRKGMLDGVIAIGGSTGMTIGTAAMKELPIGVPKLMVSTFIDPHYVGEKDIAIFQVPADIAGLNYIMRRALSTAAGAIVGMVETTMQTKPQKPVVGITALGVTTPAVMKISTMLKNEGYDVVVFHAKSQNLDELVEQNEIFGVIDLTPFELVRLHIYYPANVPRRERKDRLEPALKKGLPYIFVPGGLDMHIFRGPPEEVPKPFKTRKLYSHGPYVTLARTSKEEMVKLAKVVADKLKLAKGPAAVIIPLKGFSALDKPGGPFYDPEADGAFISELKLRLPSNVKFMVVNAHINDREFAVEVIKTWNELIKKIK